MSALVIGTDQLLFIINILYYKTFFKINYETIYLFIWCVLGHRHTSMLFSFSPSIHWVIDLSVEMLLSIKLTVDLKIQDCKLITMGVTQENNTIAGGPGYPDVRGEFLITSFKFNLCVRRLNSYEKDRIRHQNAIKGTLSM